MTKEELKERIADLEWEDFEAKTHELIMNGYQMLSAGYTESMTQNGRNSGCWWAVMLKRKEEAA